MRKLFTIFAFVLSTSFIYGNPGWDFNGQTNNATDPEPGVIALPATFSVGTPSFETGFVPPSGTGGWAYASAGWTATGTHASSEYLEFKVQKATGDNLNFLNRSFQFVIKRDVDGPQLFRITTSVDNHVSTTTFGVGSTIGLATGTVTTNYQSVTIDFNSDYSNLSSLEIRIYGFNAGSPTGKLIVDEAAFSSVSVVPIELAYIQGQSENNSTVLDWATYSEENNEYFEVQHSTDGVFFETIDFVEGAGTSIDYNEYQYIHETPENGINYYRLRQVDFDGQSSYTDIITVEYKSITTADIKVFPNPSVDYVNIQLPQNDISTDIMIYNMNGQVMQTVNNIYDNNLELNVIDWLTGQYIVIIQQGNQRITTQFVKF